MPSVTARGGTDPIPPLIAIELVLQPAETPAETAAETAAPPAAASTHTKPAGYEREAADDSKTASDSKTEPDTDAEAEASSRPQMAIRYDTPPEQIKDSLIDLIDGMVGMLQQVPKIPLPYSQAETFDLRIRHGGTMPLFFLNAPQLDHPLIAPTRACVDADLTAAIEPLDEFLKLFSPFVEFVNMDVIEFVAGIEAADKPLDEIRHEITYHREQREMILNSIPSLVNFGGLVVVHCEKVRDFLGQKHGDVASGICALIARNVSEKTDVVCAKFETMIERVVDVPADIEV